MESLIRGITIIAVFSGCNGTDPADDLPTVSLNVGTARISITTPAGFAVLADEAPQIRQQIVQVMPPQNEVHAVFIEQIDLARVLDDKAPQLRRVVSVQSDRRLANQAVTPKTWDAVKRGLARGDVAASIARNKEIVNRHLKGQGIRIDKMTLIDFEDVSPDAFVLTALVKGAVIDDDGEYPIRVSAIASRLLKDKIIMVAVSSDCDTDDDIAWAKRVALTGARSSR